MVEVKEVLRLWLKGMPKKRIALQRGIDAKTVRRQIKLAQTCGLDRRSGEAALTDELVVALAEKLRPAIPHPKGDGWRRCEEHRAFIQRHLEQRVRLSKIRKLLQRQGVLISYPSLHRFAVSELASVIKAGPCLLRTAVPAKKCSSTRAGQGKSEARPLAPQEPRQTAHFGPRPLDPLAEASCVSRRRTHLGRG